MIVGALLLTVRWGAISIAANQPSAGAEANQLHAAITNGDVESLRYWLEVRHADASTANTAEPGVTPLERCLGLAAQLEAPAGGRGSRDAAAHAASVKVLQEMVLLLHEHGARLTDADRQHFSAAVLKWYDAAIAPPASQPGATTTAPDPSDKSSLRIGLSTVAIRTDRRISCNGSGHMVYIVNETDLSVMATVTIHEDGAETAGGAQKSDRYFVDAGTSWRLGCDTATDGRHLRYDLIRWR
jgi:hypothetical protein